MVRTGKGRNKRTGSLLLLILFGMGLGCLALPETAESGVATAWVRSYDAGFLGAPHGGRIPGEATAMALDGHGNIYVAGSYRFVTLKYDASGRQLWCHRLKQTGEPQALALYGQGNVLVTGVIGYWFGEGPPYGNYATIKYDADGHKLWSRYYDGPDWPYAPSWDAARAIVVDDQGNVLVTGRSSTPDTGSDYLTIKYGPDGRRLWSRRYNGGFNDWGYGYSDWATAIAVDGQGNAYVTGTSPGSSYHNDIVTIKYSADGQVLWLRRYDGPGNSDDIAKTMAMDAQGNVYIVGRSKAPGAQSGDYDYLCIKYNATGEELWVRRYNGPGSGNDEPAAIAVDGQDNVYVTGSSKALTDVWNSNDYATVKYSPDGEELWVRRYDGPTNSDDKATAMALDAQGNVYVTGSSMGSGGEWYSHDYATIKYSPQGETLWVMRYDGPGNRSDSASAIAVDGRGHVYVTGTSVNYSSGGHAIDSFYVTIKYLQTPRNGR